MTNKEQKIFLIINLSHFGDVLLTNSLCQNLKNKYPDSKIVLLVDKPYYEAAKYQYCVDDAICMDKRGEHRGLWGLLKFAFNCKYKNKIYASFVMYDNERGIILSRLLHAKKRISGPSKLVKWLLTDIHIERKELNHMQDINGDFIRTLNGKKGIVYPIKYNVNPTEDLKTQNISKQFQNREIVGLCTVSKQKNKDMPLDTAINIINKLTKEGKTVFYFGAGKNSKEYANTLKKKGCVNFIDLTDATTIRELANIMQLCKVVITIDTGTMHLAYATGIPTICIFYKTNMIKKWAPRKQLYPHTRIIDKNYTAENILETAFDLTKNCS